MTSRSMSAMAALALPAMGFLLAACGPVARVLPLYPNQRPVVVLTAAPVNSADTAFYAYDIHWSGNDADGRVVRYEYAIDPPTTPGADTAWVSTARHHELIHFRATEAYWHPVHGWRANGFHVFAIRALDDAGNWSPVVSRAFYSYTIAPTVRITRPRPNLFLARQVPPNVEIQWEGADDDGPASKRPEKYRYRMFRRDEPGFDFTLALANPDSLRRFWAARNFAGWDSVGADTTFTRFTHLQPGLDHLFVVVAIDEAGAYSPEFTMETNMLRLVPVDPGTIGPVFTVMGPSFRYSYPSPGYSTDPLAWINVEVPAGFPIRISWFATPPEGESIAGYRWSLDGQNWSAEGDTVTSVEVGPFSGGEAVLLRIEAVDTWGMRSLAIVHLRAVAATFQNDLLVVDDTRLQVDAYPNGLHAPPSRYGGPWPAAAELDTFLFARGGFPWRGPHGVSGELPPSKPGILAGYAFDTLGTRLGFAIASTGVPIGLLGRYRHVLWITDLKGVTTLMGPESVIDPISTLCWMSSPGRQSTLGVYAAMGGEIWLAGGTAATATLKAWNASGALNNDGRYGPGHRIYSPSAGELVPGQVMYDLAHWRSEMAASAVITTPRKSNRAVGGWSNPGWNYSGTITAPDYTRLPAQLRLRALALGDSLPPTCLANSQRFYTPALPVQVEYLTEDNYIVEDFDPDPLVEDRGSALDTLYELQGGVLATQQTGRRPVTMTYYHGVETPRFVFTGFDLWSWSRQDVAALVDFVLQDLWGMTRGPVAPAPLSAAPARAIAVPAAPARAAPAAARPANR